MVILYILAKFALYSAVCAFAFRMFKVTDRSELSFATSWAALRMLIGVVFIIPILMLDSQLASKGVADLQSYLVSFGAMRVLEWLLLFLALRWQYKLRIDGKSIIWIGIGIGASFLSDGIAVITGASNIRLFC